MKDRAVKHCTVYTGHASDITNVTTLQEQFDTVDNMTYFLFSNGTKLIGDVRRPTIVLSPSRFKGLFNTGPIQCHYTARMVIFHISFPRSLIEIFMPNLGNYYTYEQP